MTSTFPGRLALQQRVLPNYRAPFLENLGAACERGLHVFAGEPLPVEGITPARDLKNAQFTAAHNRHFQHPRHPLYLCWQGGLLDWLKEAQPDALVVEANPRYPSTRGAIRWMRANRKPVLGWGLGAPAIKGPFSSLRERSRSRFLASLDGLIAYSQRGAEDYRRVGVPPDQVFVATNATASRPARTPPERPPGFTGQPNLLFVGRLQARKRVDNLLHACAKLPEHLKPNLVVVGDGPAEEDLQALAETIYPEAEFTGGRFGSELDPLFAAADLFVLPGTGGLAVQQAMSHGLPVVVAKGDGTQDDLVRPSNGWQINPDDLSTLVDTLQEALSDPTRLRKMGRESFRIVREEINLETMATRFIDAINHTVESYPG